MLLCCWWDYFTQGNLPSGINKVREKTRWTGLEDVSLIQVSPVDSLSVHEGSEPITVSKHSTMCLTSSCLYILTQNCVIGILQSCQGAEVRTHLLSLLRTWWRWVGEKRTGGKNHGRTSPCIALATVRGCDWHWEDGTRVFGKGWIKAYRHSWLHKNTRSFRTSFYQTRRNELRSSLTDGRNLHGQWWHTRSATTK